MFVSTFGAFGLILYLNFSNTKRLSMQEAFSDRDPIPYFRGFYDVVKAPLAMEAILNFWLPLLLVALLIFGIIKQIMPSYYKEVLYTKPSEKEKPAKKGVLKAYQNKNLAQLLCKHHLLTLQNATLLTQTFLMPLLYVFIFITLSLTSGADLKGMFSADYFGIMMLMGGLLGSMCALPTTFVGVGISLEKDNFIFIKSLPISLKAFLIGKYRLLVTLQLIVPLILYTVLGFFVLKLDPILTLSFLLGFALVVIVQGQFMYRRDYKLLDLKWQDMTQLFTRGSGQWYTMGLMFGNILLGAVVIVVAVILSRVSGQALVIDSILAILIGLGLLASQIYLSKSFWKSFDRL
ncbi:putative membrane protein [Streptococcus ictaluri 707-05]|uniref:Membrane protein n=1 Tax=Streptococcus ictaluri 707-05 TaxID=764299 RepID=G5K4C6_9STRE|nr:putative membrane protein [Streptococcus ictaluri 707-05]